MTKGITVQKGLTLLEVLIALVVLSVGLLGIAGMQATGLRNNHAAYTKTQATALATDMADRIRANPQGAASYAGLDTSISNTMPDDANCTPVAACNPVPVCISSGCTPTQMAAVDKYQWSRPLVSTTNPVLPNGQGKITKSGDNFTITLFWLEPNYKGVERSDCAGGQASTETACFKMTFQP